MQTGRLFILILLLTTGCAVSRNVAPIEYNHRNSSYSTSYSVSEETVSVVKDGEVSAVPFTSESKLDEELAQLDKLNQDKIVPEKEQSQSHKIIYHEVKAGETIDKIAKIYNQSVNDIAVVNELEPPYQIEPPYILKIKVRADFNKTPKLAKEAKESKHQDSQEISKKAEFPAPVKGKIISKFGDKTQYGVNKGINIAAPEGTKVIAIATGKIIYADFDATFGNLVIIKLANKNIVISYAHLEDIIVEKGATLQEGEIVGYVGKTGKVKEPQLHFGIREGTKAIDPLKLIAF